VHHGRVWRCTATRRGRERGRGLRAAAPRSNAQRCPAGARVRRRTPPHGGSGWVWTPSTCRADRPGHRVRSGRRARLDAARRARSCWAPVYDDTALGGHPDGTRWTGRRWTPGLAGHRSRNVCLVNSPMLAMLGLLDGTAVVTGRRRGGHRLRRPAHRVARGAGQQLAAEVLRRSRWPCWRRARQASRVYAPTGSPTSPSAVSAPAGSGIRRWSWPPTSEPRRRRAAYQGGADAVDGFAAHAGPAAPRIPSGSGWTWGCAPGSATTEVRIGPVKIFMDGSLSARTAAMHEEFCDRDRTATYRTTRTCCARTWWTRTPPAGGSPRTHRRPGHRPDPGLLRRSAARPPRPDARPRIEHAAVTSEEQSPGWPRSRHPGAAGAVPLRDRDSMAAAVGPKRVDRLYRHAASCAPGCGTGQLGPAGGRRRPLLGIQSMIPAGEHGGLVIGPDERVDALTRCAPTPWTRPGSPARSTRAAAHPRQAGRLRAARRQHHHHPRRPDRHHRSVATFLGGTCVHGPREW